MNSKKLSADDLSQFTGTELWYRHSLNRKVLYSVGARYVAETAGSYWLLDEIALAQLAEPAIAAEEFQVWKLAVNPDRTAVLSCQNGDFVFQKKIEFTDFPLAEISFWFANNTIFLPSEY